MTSDRSERAPARSSAGAPTSRTPFVLLMVLLLGGGLLGLLLLNTALNQGSFEQSRLKKQNARLSDEEQALRRELEAVSAPSELARKAEELGMVPGTTPVFIDPVTGQIFGTPKPASPRPTPTPTPPTLPTTPPQPTILPSATPAPPATATAPVQQTPATQPTGQTAPPPR
ncbi:cell division protein FtsL [Yinghuangia sp. YIM S09857]|uniref:cell division protein FtsL n=1 Tax=Yinghuangia sp. YIM S09857 TaxID=3436929 RepID=UPI003F539263